MGTILSHSTRAALEQMVDAVPAAGKKVIPQRRPRLAFSTVRYLMHTEVHTLAVKQFSVLGSQCGNDENNAASDQQDGTEARAPAADCAHSQVSKSEPNADETAAKE